MDIKTLGERMRSGRGKRTRREVAALVGCTERTIARWEAGEGAPPVDDLDRYARAIGLTSIVPLVRGLS
jgi:transcriptional regulator with XRE-family HTH domain